MTESIFGLPGKAVEGIRAVLASNPKVEKAVLYGSRAKGTFRGGSDIDLTLVGNALEHSDLTALMGKLDDLLLPYSIDLSILATISHADLVEHIKRVGVVFYEKAARSSGS
jgi:predicted nucleotidyltransferase